GVTGNKETSAGFWLNVSLVLLVAASVFLAWGGYRTVHVAGIDSAVRTAEAFVASTAHVGDNSLVVKSLSVSADAYEVDIQSQTGLYKVTVDAQSGKVLSYTAP